MLKATIKAVSKDATKLGIKIGMTGAEAMELLRQRLTTKEYLSSNYQYMYVEDVFVYTALSTLPV